MPNLDSPAATAKLSLWDAVSLIVGIVVGSSIYRAPPLIFGNSGSPAIGLLLWLLGGVLSLIGALIYAELATTYPRCGGEYNYLTRAYGPWLGFLFAWSQLAIIQTASIGALSYVFADYAIGLWKLPASSAPWLAGSAVINLTLLNLIGLRAGAWLQNVLTVLKLAGLTAIVVMGIGYGTADPWTAPAPTQGPGWTLALILILYAYGGWSDAGFVAAEVRDVSRNIPRALLGGLGLIVVIYLLVNFAYLRALGGAGLAQSERPAAETLTLVLGQRGGQVMSLLVMASALGGVNGLIFSVSRVHASLGQDYRLFAWLGRFNNQESPVASLLAQAAVTVGMVITVGTTTGQALLNQLVIRCGLPAIHWSDFGGGFETLVAGSAPAFWLFFVLNAIGFLILRVTDAQQPRPFRVPLSPLTPLIFVAVCGWMLYSSATYAFSLLPVMSVPLLAGIPAYILCRCFQPQTEADARSPSPPAPQG